MVIYFTNSYNTGIQRKLLHHSYATSIDCPQYLSVKGEKSRRIRYLMTLIHLIQYFFIWCYKVLCVLGSRCYIFVVCKPYKDFYFIRKDINLSFEISLINRCFDEDDLSRKKSLGCKIWYNKKSTTFFTNTFTVLVIFIIEH